MKNNFVPYSESLSLKELGFTEKNSGILGCHHVCDTEELRQIYQVEHFFTLKSESFNSGCEKIIAPLYQQAFKFFRDKYNLDSIIERDWALRGLSKQYCYVFDRGDYSDTSISYESINYNTYEEAELECLKKLIEIHQINLI